MFTKKSESFGNVVLQWMSETLRQLIDQKPSQWIKFQDWEPDKQRLEFKTVAGNKEHKFIGQK